MDELERLRQERDEYRDLSQTLGERVTQMTSAAVSAAASTVTAIERLQELQEVVDAAVEWTAATRGFDWSALAHYVGELQGVVDKHLLRVRSRS